jgi:hypothetical protein
MNFFEYLPIEIYKHYLFFVRPKDICHACTINKHTSSICDDKFYNEYIQRNCQPQSYGLERFTLPHYSNWKSYLNMLVNGITLPAEIIVKSDTSNILNTTVNVYFKDTLQDIWDNVKNIIGDKYLNKELHNVTLIGTFGDEKLVLAMYLNYARLDMLINPTAAIVKPIIGHIFKTNPITKINNNEGFYLNIEKIRVRIGD